MTGYDFLGTMGEQARGTYEPKHRADPPSVIEQALARIGERGGVVVRVDGEADRWDVRAIEFQRDGEAVLTLSDVWILAKATEVLG